MKPKAPDRRELTSRRRVFPVLAHEVIEGLAQEGLEVNVAFERQRMEAAADLATE